MHSNELLTLQDRVGLLVAAMSKDRNLPPIVRLYLPHTDAVWLISEGHKTDADLLFGLVDLGLGCPALGFVSLAELINLRGPLGATVKRDADFVAKKRIASYANEAHSNGRIIA